MTALPLGTESQSVDAFLEQRCESSASRTGKLAAMAAYEPSKVRAQRMLECYIPLARPKRQETNACCSPLSQPWPPTSTPPQR